MKVFSTRAYLIDVANCEDIRAGLVIMSLQEWATKCDGMTEQEMNECGYMTCDSWLVSKQDFIPFK